MTLLLIANILLVSKDIAWPELSGLSYGHSTLLLMVKPDLLCPSGFFFFLVAKCSIYDLRGLSGNPHCPQFLVIESATVGRDLLPKYTENSRLGPSGERPDPLSTNGDRAREGEKDESSCGATIRTIVTGYYADCLLYTSPSPRDS